MKINELTDELVADAYISTDTKPGKFDQRPEACPLEVISWRQNCHWTQVIEDQKSMNDFVEVWDRLSSGFWMMVDRKPWRAPTPSICVGDEPAVVAPLEIRTEGGQRAVDLWNYLTDQGLIAVRLPDA